MDQGVELTNHATIGLNFAGSFSASLLDPEKTVSISVSGNGGTTKRDNVYRNNVTVSLIDALAVPDQ